VAGLGFKGEGPPNQHPAWPSVSNLKRKKCGHDHPKKNQIVSRGASHAPFCFKSDVHMGTSHAPFCFKLDVHAGASHAPFCCWFMNACNLQRLSPSNRRFADTPVYGAAIFSNFFN
jgi:hypothetical protein